MQSYEGEYRPEASADILKWKPAHCNSVDFTLLGPDDPAVTGDSRAQGAVTFNVEHFLGVLSNRQIVLACELVQV